MQSSDLPTRLVLPFANAGTKTSPFPVASQVGTDHGAASLTDGFPPDTMVPYASGGVAPDGADMNGIMFLATSWNRWQAVGGPVFHNVAFSTAIGGYPKGTVLTADALNGTAWFSTVENNTTDPDAGGAGWLSLSSRGRLIGVQTFASSGTYTPTLGTTAVVVEAVGAGGGGGGAVVCAAGENSAGIAGNAGSYGKGLYASGFSGATVTIGSGGAGGNGAAGGNGSTTIVGSLLSCPGGPGGGAGPAQTGSASGGNGSGSGNPTGANIVGATGGIAQVSFGFSTGQVAYGGAGGHSFYGAGGLGQQTKLNGASSPSPGGGGGGTIGTGNTLALVGGNGSNGLVIIWEYS